MNFLVQIGYHLIPVNFIAGIHGNRKYSTLNIEYETYNASTTLAVRVQPQHFDAAFKYCREIINDNSRLCWQPHWDMPEPAENPAPKNDEKVKSQHTQFPHLEVGRTVCVHVQSEPNSWELMAIKSVDWVHNQVRAYSSTYPEATFAFKDIVPVRPKRYTSYDSEWRHKKVLYGRQGSSTTLEEGIIISDIQAADDCDKDDGGYNTDAVVIRCLRDKSLVNCPIARIYAVLS